MPARVQLVSDDRMLAHDPGADHPERPARLAAIRAELDRAPIPSATWTTPTPATRSDIELIHTPEHVDSIERLRGRRAAIDLDTITSPASVDAAYLAAGAAIDATRAVMSGDAMTAFALARPPGHHAEPGRAMGFCLFNNIAIAAAVARQRLGAQRILIIDWDVHHGNGTQAAFWRDPDTLFFSTHQWPAYPGTGAMTEVGEGPGAGRTVNVPMMAGMGDGDLAAVFDRLLTPLAHAFRPDLILVSAGFDAHAADPLAEMQATENGFAHMCAVTKAIADRWARGRIALILEGGYDLPALAASTRACVEVLAGTRTPAPIPHTVAGAALASRIRRIQSQYWPALRD